MDRRLPHPHPQVVHRRVGEGVVLLEPRSETYFGLDGAGAVIWEALVEGTPTQAALVARLAARWPAVAPARLEADAAALLATLEAAGLVVAAPGAASGT